MELRQLEYFVAVARHGQFTRAADALWVTQPALSQQIRRLEAELGVVLLRRTSRGVRLTAAGEDLFAHAQVVLGELARAREAIGRHAGVTRGRVRVAATTIDTPRLPGALAAFHREHPGLQVALRHASTAEIVALVATGEVDVGVAGPGGDVPAGLTTEQLSDEPLRAMLPAGDPLARESEIALSDLAGRAFILAEPGSGLREAVVAACQRAGFSPVPLFEISDSATVRHLVEAGLGISVAPSSWFEVPGPEVVAGRLARPAPRHRVSALTLATGRSPAADLLVAALQAVFG
ncbi:MAG TPA: LysR family transcriptional regulator [Solirubrobacteraceae bacterium]|nr:LysR family transcriptional regulator [Solirubrobacteraceae bacterium]